MRVYMLVRHKHKHEHDRASEHPHMHECALIERVINDPPPTWIAYKHDALKQRRIIDMEVAELLEAARSGDHKGYCENLIHVAAACVDAYRAEMKKKGSDDV